MMGIPESDLYISLQAHFKLLIDNMRTYLEAKIDGNEYAHGLAATQLEHRLSKFNDTRALVSDMASRYVTKSESELRFEKIEDDVRELRESRAELAGKASMASVTISYLLGSAALLITIFELVLKWAGGK